MAAANFCKPGSMSTCTAGKSWKDQSRCFFAEKSTDMNRCMFYMFDEFCDCVKAQQADFNPVESDISKFEIEPKYDGYDTRKIREASEGTVFRGSGKPIDVTNRKVKKVCPIDYTTICSKAFCTQWNWCKDPFKHK